VLHNFLDQAGDEVIDSCAMICNLDHLDQTVELEKFSVRGSGLDHSIRIQQNPIPLL
jgi:hypothetical protein